jgi:predicted SnoaL-like aldol condensation-catalyzing enzyme
MLASVSWHIEEFAMSKKLENAVSLYLEGIRDGRIREAVTKCTGARYIEHSTGVKDGVEGFVEFFERFIDRYPSRDIQIVRTIEDGQYVFLHVYSSLNDGEAEYVITDFFDTDENDKLIEHWDVISKYIPHTPSGHTSIDGPTEITALENTQENKQLVRNFIVDVLIGDAPENIENYISRGQYIQHSAVVPDGLEHVKSPVLAEKQQLHYEEIFLLVGQGNFVATLCKAFSEDQPIAQVDIFRIEEGKIVEHWGNSEPIPPADKLVNSGKF